VPNGEEESSAPLGKESSFSQGGLQKHRKTIRSEGDSQERVFIFRRGGTSFLELRRRGETFYEKAAFGRDKSPAQGGGTTFGEGKSAFQLYIWRHPEGAEKKLLREKGEWRGRNWEKTILSCRKTKGNESESGSEVGTLFKIAFSKKKGMMNYIEKRGLPDVTTPVRRTLSKRGVRRETVS